MVHAIVSIGPIVLAGTGTCPQITEEMRSLGRVQGEPGPFLVWHAPAESE